jgi:predicted amidohydrolase YtcJ
VDAVAAAQATNPRFDHRHFIVHAQMVDEALLRRMAALGICATLFPNHLYYWGDFHYSQTIGPSRAQCMNPLASALRLGVPVGVHSDTPVSPIDPLFSAWCAVNRVTSSGRVLGPDERISVLDALKLITVGAAYLLHIDKEVGSIQVGKRADFVVLGEDPLAVGGEHLKDVPVLGTVLGGQPVTH